MLTAGHVRMAICGLRIHLRSAAGPKNSGLSAQAISHMQQGRQSRESNRDKLGQWLESQGARFEIRDGLAWVGIPLEVAISPPGEPEPATLPLASKRR